MVPEKIELPVGKILAVGSGKGGVGKSTVSANLAVALAAEGFRTGLLDADVYGPNLPMMFGVEGAPATGSDGAILPVAVAGVDLVSLGFLVRDSDAMMWRGPMVHKFVQQLLGMTRWPKLDYLVVDLPPGTGDVQLSLSQLVGVDGSLIVTTPQPVAVADARRGVTAFRTLKVPVLGVVENMAGEVFGSGGGEQAAEEMEVPFLGRIPLDPLVRSSSDRGRPVTAADRNHPVSSIFLDLADRIRSALE